MRAPRPPGAGGKITPRGEPAPRDTRRHATATGIGTCPEQCVAGYWSGGSSPSASGQDIPTGILCPWPFSRDVNGSAAAPSRAAVLHSEHDLRPNCILLLNCHPRTEVERVGLEPTTPALQRRCSPS